MPVPLLVMRRRLPRSARQPGPESRSGQRDGPGPWLKRERCGIRSRRDTGFSAPLTYRRDRIVGRDKPAHDAAMRVRDPDGNAYEGASEQRRSPPFDSVARPHDGETVGAGHQARGMFRPQAALAGGFAIVFALWIAWGYQLIPGLEPIEAHSVRVPDAPVRGAQILLNLRTH